MPMKHAQMYDGTRLPIKGYPGQIIALIEINSKDIL